MYYVFGRPENQNSSKTYAFVDLLHLIIAFIQAKIENPQA
jgi:hypothetical protein